MASGQASGSGSASSGGGTAAPTTTRSGSMTFIDRILAAASGVGRSVATATQQLTQPSPPPPASPSGEGTIQRLSAAARAMQQDYGEYIKRSKAELISKCGMNADQASLLLAQGSAAINAKLASCGAGSSTKAGVTAMQKDYAAAMHAKYAKKGIPWWVWVGGGVLVVGGVVMVARKR